jgi:hypothetical protein
VSRKLVCESLDSKDFLSHCSSTVAYDSVSNQAFHGCIGGVPVLPFSLLVRGCLFDGENGGGFVPVSICKFSHMGAAIVGRKRGGRCAHVLKNIPLYPKFCPYQL